MKFQIKRTNNIEERKLFYRSEDYAFDTEPTVSGVDFEVIINKITLTVTDNRVVQVWGFCPYGSWIRSIYNVPKYTKGILKVIDNLEPGSSYAIDQNDWPVYVNVQTGWICIGNPEITGKAAEFINNCVVVLKDGELKSLWLKPQSLPEFFSL